MKRIPILVVALVLLGAGIGSLARSPSGRHVLVLMGDTDGYLSPCGCTKPMTGGIRRRASAVRMLTAGTSSTVLENGGLVSGSGRQDHLKAEALAEALRQMGVTAANITYSEAKLGAGLIQSMRNLAGEIFVQSNLKPSETNSLPAFTASGPFLIGGISRGHEAIARTLGEASMSNDEAAKHLVEEAEQLGLSPMLMVSDGEQEARRLAKAVPGLRFIQYRSTGKPLAEPIREGNAILLSPGESGKHVLSCVIEDGKLVSYRPVELTPDFKDDQAVSRVYSAYLSRVDSENLLEKIPRTKSPSFAGTPACIKCHAQAGEVWTGSAHARALKTLEEEGHGRDPDCVGCHVVALKASGGFRSASETPELANVGCESCHGPGAAHAAEPKQFKMGKAGPESCAACHVPAHSPGFDFAEYWKRIRHQ
jgi:hypothetical protein